MMKPDDNLGLSHCSCQGRPRAVQETQHFLEKWTSVYMKQRTSRPHCAGRPKKLTGELNFRAAEILARVVEMLPPWCLARPTGHSHISTEWTAQ